MRRWTSNDTSRREWRWRKQRVCITPLGRFMAKVRQTEGCWEWTGHSEQGYGRFNVGGAGKLAYRVLYEWLNGPLANGIQLDHTCGNRGCVRPEHLEPVTMRENHRRANRMAMGAPRRNQTHCKWGHPFDAKNTQYIDSPRGRERRCRACNARRSREIRRRAA